MAETGFPEEDPPEEGAGRARMIMVGFAGMAVAALVFGGAILYLTEHDQGLVILKADREPYKIRPSDPGGRKLDNLESPVLGMLDPLNKKETGREVLTPPETAPEPPPIAVDSSGAPSAGGTAPGDTPGDAPGDAARDTTGDSPKDSPDDAPGSAAAPASGGEGGTGRAEAAGAGRAAGARPDEPLEPAAPAPSAAASSGAASSGAASAGRPAADRDIDDVIARITGSQPGAPAGAREVTGGDEPFFVVQFAAFRSEANATGAAAVLAAKHASRLGDVGIGYMRSGEFWRVVTDPLPRPEAAAMCRRFRSVGQDCIVKLVEPAP